MVFTICSAIELQKAELGIVMLSFFKFFFRLSGYLFLACALIAIVADGSRSIARSELTLMPLGQFWYEHAQGSLNAAQAAIQRHVSPVLWDPDIQTMLTWPIWAVFLLFGAAFLWLGTRRRQHQNVYA